MADETPTVIDRGPALEESGDTSDPRIRCQLCGWPPRENDLWSPRFDLLLHWFEAARHPINTETHFISENDFECLASTGVNAPGTMFPNRCYES